MINVFSTERPHLQTKYSRVQRNISVYNTFPFKCVAAHLIGTLNGHRFEALVFAEHAECPDYELGDSRISKLWLKGLNGGETVANFDRGWDIRPTTKSAQTIVDFLAAGLAEHTYGK